MPGFLTPTTRGGATGSEWRVTLASNPRAMPGSDPHPKGESPGIGTGDAVLKCLARQQMEGGAERSDDWVLLIDVADGHKANAAQEGERGRIDDRFDDGRGQRRVMVFHGRRHVMPCNPRTRSTAIGSRHQVVKIGQPRLLETLDNPGSNPDRVTSLPQRRRAQGPVVEDQGKGLESTIAPPRDLRTRPCAIASSYS